MEEEAIKKAMGKIQKDVGKASDEQWQRCENPARGVRTGRDLPLGAHYANL
jgi:hypothetical protein